MMTETQKRMMRVAAGLGFFAVLLGAFGAHGLKRTVTAEMLTVFETGCRYHFLHALALLALAGVACGLKEKTLRWVCRCWVYGVIIFSGSLYLLVLTGIKRFGMITPFGGLLLMLGWGILFLGALSRKGKTD